MRIPLSHSLALARLAQAHSGRKPHCGVGDGEEERVRGKLLLAALCAVFLSLGAVSPHASGDAVKIGVLNDQSGIYADLSGQGSVIAARMAAEDFGGTRARQADRDRLRRSSEQAGCRGGDRIALVRCGERRRDRRRSRVLGRARRAGSRASAQAHRDVFRRGQFGSDRQGLLAVRHAMELRHASRWPRAPRSPSPSPAATLGSSSPPTTRSAPPWRRTRGATSPQSAAR